ANVERGDVGGYDRVLEPAAIERVSSAQLNILVPTNMKITPCNLDFFTKRGHLALVGVLVLLTSGNRLWAADAEWPPALKGAKAGTVTLKTDRFLDVPESVATAVKKGAAPFTVAKTAPTVDFAYHRDLGPNAVSRRLWSSWGDICVASDGRVYAAI